jgi:hypothetical protein
VLHLDEATASPPIRLPFLVTVSSLLSRCSCFFFFVLHHYTQFPNPQRCHADAKIDTCGRSNYMANLAILLAVVVALFVNAMFIVAMLHCRFDPRVTLFYVSSLLLYTALYLWRRLRYRHAVLRRGLGYSAVGLAAFLSALFLYSFAPGIPLLPGSC